MEHRSFTLAACLGLALGCSTSTEGGGGDDPAGGKADDPEANGDASIYAVGNRLDPWDGDDAYMDQVQPIVARQCVTCHGCGDSPCQLKLTSYEGVLRGSNEDDLYSSRILSVKREYDPMHLAYGRVLHDDGSVDYDGSEERWRDHDFYSVTEHQSDSLLARVLTEAHDRTSSLDEAFKVGGSLDSRKFECLQSDSPDGDAMVGRAMPLGLPALEGEDTDTLVDWLDEGAAGPSTQAQLEVAAPASPEAIQEWEAFFNSDPADARARLVSRYLYEHLFFAHLHFSRSAGEFYRLVRSRTQTGPIDELVTERIWDVPEDSEFFYRLQKVTSVLVAKSHVTWDLGPETMERWDELFHKADWSLEESEIFEPDSENPFAYFAAIPANIRYRFMIENSKQLVDAMVRGSVCTGSGATFAIRDRFWVWFLDPDSDVSSLDEVDGTFTGGPRLAEGSWFHLNPESANPLRENDYLRAYRTQLQKHRPDGLAVSDLWDGDEGRNNNAWLTVLRHHKSATVHQGPMNGAPETIWVLSYSNFERLYYNLVVQFKVWSHVAHKVETWGLMSYVRSEGEDLFAAMLEPELREELRAHPTRGWGKISTAVFPSYGLCSDDREDELGDGCEYPTAVDFPEPSGSSSTERLDGQMLHLAGLVADHIGGGLTLEDPLNEVGAAEIPATISSREELEAAFDALTGWTSDAWQHLPELTVVRVTSGGESWLYTIVANRIYEAHERVYQESLGRVPEVDTLSINRGIVGHYPALFVDLPLEDAAAFIGTLAQVKSAEDWAELVRLGTERGRIIDRQSPAFWTFLDEVHIQWFSEDPVEAAVLDVSEYLWPQDL